MAWFKYVFVAMATVAVGESLLVPLLFHPLTMPKHHVLFNTKAGFNEALRIYSFSVTFNQLDKETENLIYAQMNTQEKNLYDNVVKKFEDHFFTTSQIKLKPLMEFVLLNTNQIKKVDKRLEEIFCHSEKAKNETVYVSELDTILKFFTRSSMQDYVNIKNHVISDFSREEKDLISTTTAVIKSVALEIDDIYVVISDLRRFLKHYKTDIKKLVQKIRQIQKNNGQLDELTSKENRAEGICRNRKNGSSIIQVLE